MATYNSNQLLANAGLSALAANKTFMVSQGGLASGSVDVVLTAAPTVSDAINFGVVPKGFRLFSATLESTDLDTGTTVTINVGDALLATRLFAASNVGQAATASSALSTTGHGYQYPDDTMITGALAAGPGTNGGTLTLTLTGRLEGLPS
jgi:hypothetical protein